MPRITPVDTTRRLVASWSNGKEILGGDGIFRGWFLDMGLDPALDAAATAAGWPHGDLGHLDGAARAHWLIPSPLVIFPLIDGLPFTRLGALAASDVSYAGIGCSWAKGQRSRLGIMALIRDLLAHGYETPIPFCTSSTATDDLLAALLRHNELLDALERATREAGRPRTYAFCDIGLPLQPGPRVMRGTGALTSQLSPISCAHPAEFSLEALRRIVHPDAGLVAPAVVARVKAERWAAIVAWAAEFRQAGLRRAEPPSPAGAP